MKRLNIKLAAIGLLLLALTGCGKDTFCVSGHVNNAEGETLYLEQLGLMKTEIIDSIVLPKNGTFKFREQRPEYPDLYRLRIGNATLVLAVDSLEHITVEAEDRLPEAVIGNSEKSEQIRELRRSLRDKPLDEHRAFAKNLILSDPISMVSYYAVFQQKAGLPVFNIYDKGDRVVFSAVATSFNTWMPKYYRSKALYNQVMDVINGERHAQQVAAMQAFIEESENTFLDINLPDENGENQSLSQYKGKLIVVDFASTVMDRYTGYIFEMKDIYNTYHSRGLEIYEVYPDPSRLVWEEQVRALPWTTVRTENGVNDIAFRTFNVQAIPTLFLYNRKGEVVGRFGDFESLKKAIEKAL